MNSLTFSLSLPRLLRTGLFLTPLVFGSPGFSADATSVATAKKDHFLFMGSDVEIMYEKKYYPIVGVRGDNLQIRTPSRLLSVHKLKLEGFKFEPDLKVTTHHAMIDGLKVERCFTPETDPNRKLQEQIKASIVMQDNLDLKANQNLHAAVAASTPTLTTAGMPGSPPTATYSASAIDYANQMAGEISTIQGSSDSFSRTASTFGEISREQFDAIRVSLSLSTQQSFDDPYLLVITQFRGPEDPKNKINHWFYGERVGTLGERPDKFSFMIKGLPPGFTLLGYQIHLYDHGREIATNLSQNQVAITREEAVKYLLIQYLAAHKADTLHPSLGISQDAAAMVSALSPMVRKKKVFIRVDAEGNPIKTSLDKEGKEAADSGVTEAIQKMWFFPALDKGKPIAGLVAMTLNETL